MRVRERENKRGSHTQEICTHTHTNTHGLKLRESGIHTDKEVEMNVERKK